MKNKQEAQNFCDKFSSFLILNHAKTTAGVC